MALKGRLKNLSQKAEHFTVKLELALPKHVVVIINGFQLAIVDFTGLLESLRLPVVTRYFKKNGH